MAKTKIEKIASIEEEIKQLENKKKRLIQEQKEQERKDRTNRLCKRMGFIEKLLPGTIPLTEEQFKTFVEQTIATDHSRRILDGLTAQNAATAPAQGAGTAGRGNPSPPPKPPRQRRRTAQTGARCKGNGLAGRGREGVLNFSRPCWALPRRCSVNRRGDMSRLCQSVLEIFIHSKCDFQNILQILVCFNDRLFYPIIYIYKPPGICPPRCAKKQYTVFFNYPN